MKIVPTKKYLDRGNGSEEWVFNDLSYKSPEAIEELVNNGYLEVVED